MDVLILKAVMNVSSILAIFDYFISTYSSNVDVLILTYGALGGQLKFKANVTTSHVSKPGHPYSACTNFTPWSSEAVIYSDNVSTHPGMKPQLSAWKVGMMTIQPPRLMTLVKP